MLKFLIFAGVTAGLAAMASAWLLMSPLRVAAMVAKFERSRAGMQAKVLEIPISRMAYLDGGKGDVLLLVHGSSGEKDNWNRVARFLTPHLRVIAVDLPGYGDSEMAAGAAHGLGDQIEYLRAFVAALGLQSFHLGGHSSGGRIAAMYAARHSGQVKSLWLLAPGGVLSAEPSDLSLLLARGEPNPLFIRTEAEFDDYLGMLMAQPPMLPGFVKRGLAARAIARAALQEMIFNHVRASGEPLEDVVVGASRIPAHIVWGDRDRVWHVSGAAILQRSLPRASILLLPGMGHVPIFEAPRQVAEAYLDFLKTQPEQQLLAAAE